jgi:hypothetical protein
MSMVKGWGVHGGTPYKTKRTWVGFCVVTANDTLWVGYGERRFGLT